jgi:hypothetical protein
MNYIKHLTGFFERVTQDKTLNPTHVSLYMSLFQFWNCNRFKNPISISRDEVMRISKISSKATYHKCLKNLHALGYIKYEPSYNPFRGSHVIMFNFAEDLKPQPKTSSKTEPFFEPVSGQVLNKQEISNEQALVPSINNTNIPNTINISNLDKHQQNDIEENYECIEDAENTSKQKKLRQKNKGFTSPTKDRVISFFEQNNYPAVEANKFYNYFSSIGWLVGGKTQMVDWEAAAHNWMLNAEKFKGVVMQNQHLNTVSDKNYAEPL